MVVSKTRNTLVDVARQLFAKKGFDDTTMNDIALASKSMPPEDKLVEIIYAHLNLIKEAVSRNGNLRAEFFRDIWMVEKVRKKFDQAEIDLFIHVLEEGIAAEEFKIENISLVAEIMHYCVKGMEVPYIYGRLGDGLNQTNSRPLVRNLVHRALRK